MSKKERLDLLLFKRGLVESRQRARALIIAGKVLVDGVALTKTGALVSPDADITIQYELPYVSRGGLKLQEALDFFKIDLKDKIAMDVGASTGGFTDCILQRGAKRVYAVDVGYGQLHWRLRKDPRVVVMEKTNIRYLERDKIPEDIDIATIDLSFISLIKVLPKVKEFLGHGAEVLALVKPQFEVGREEVEKGGVVRSEAKRLKAVQKVCNCLEELGFRIEGTKECTVKGQKKGNVEYFVYAILKENPPFVLKCQ